MNKHDELLRKIKALPNGNIGYQQNIPENSDLSFVECLATDELKSLADEYEKLRKENAKLKYNKQIEELNMELSKASDFYDRDQITYEQYSNVLFSVESRKAALKARQSGEEG